MSKKDESSDGFSDEDFLISPAKKLIFNKEESSGSFGDDSDEEKVTSQTSTSNFKSLEEKLKHFGEPEHEKKNIQNNPPQTKLQTISLEDYEKKMGQKKPVPNNNLSKFQDGSDEDVFGSDEEEVPKPKPTITTKTQTTQTSSTQKPQLNVQKTAIATNAPKVDTTNLPQIEFEVSSFDQTYFESLPRTWDAPTRFYSQLRYINGLLGVKEKEAKSLLQDYENRTELVNRIKAKNLIKKNAMPKIEEDVSVVQRSSLKLNLFKMPNPWSVIFLFAALAFLVLRTVILEYDRTYLENSPVRFAT